MSVARRQGWWIAVALVTSMLSGVRIAEIVATTLLPRQVVAAGILLPIQTEAGFYVSLDHLEERMLRRPLRLVAADSVWYVVAADLGITLDRMAMWEDLVGRKPGEGYLTYLLRMRGNGHRELGLRLTYDSTRLDEFLALVGSQVWRAPTNAHIDPITGRLAPEVPGQSLDVQATRERLLLAWREGEPQVYACVRTVEPATLAEDIRGISVKHALGQFSSYFDPNDEGRRQNISLAAQLLHGIVVEPQREFSFNETVGPRTLERGFRPAPEIVNQELVPGIGGGGVPGILNPVQCSASFGPGDHQKAEPFAFAGIRTAGARRCSILWSD